MCFGLALQPHWWIQVLIWENTEAAGLGVLSRDMSVSPEVSHAPRPGPTEWFPQSYPCGVSSRAFKTAMTRPRWAPESFSRPMMMISPPCLRNQNQEEKGFAQEAILSSGYRTSVLVTMEPEVFVRGVKSTTPVKFQRHQGLLALISF